MSEKFKLPRLHTSNICKFGQDERFIILPIGLYVNQSVQKAQNGDRVCFQESWRKRLYVIKRKVKIPTASPMFSFMCSSVYGHGSFEKLAAEWRVMCVIEGLGEDAFDSSSVLLVELGEWDKVAFIAEEKRKQAIAEAIIRQKEKAELLKLARDEGIYKHPDIF